MIAPALLRIAVQALTANKLRSGLTLLGVIVGVTSVMTIISALEGMQAGIKRVFDQLGPATFVIDRMGVITSEEMFWDKVRRKPLKLATAELIEDHCPLCDKISPRDFRGARIKYGREAMRDVLVIGAQSTYVEIVDYQEAQGRFHSREEDLAGKRVVFIGEQIRESLFSGVDPLGKELQINGVKYTVIGVAKKQGSMFGDNMDSWVLIPFSAMIRQFGNPGRNLDFVVKAVSVEKLPEAMDQARMVLRAQRKVPFDKPDDFDLLTADNILEALNSFTQAVRMGLVLISSISVVVGGIVVMNIMMVAVTERTREIGIRKSVGARRRHILMQFVFEALLMCLLGGAIGIAAGFFIARVLVSFIDMQIQPSMVAIFTGLIISTAVGLFFGIYPAMKAARLDPVKALSYE